jgi:predicted nucleic acid-binding protein
VFVDTSAWVALFSGRDQHHIEADRAFRTALARGVALLTTNLVVAELHRLLLFRAGTAAAAAAIERIDSSDCVTIGFADATHHRAALQWLDRLSNHRITYTDAVSFSVMAACGCGASITYDRDFAVAGFDIAPFKDA